MRAQSAILLLYLPFILAATADVGGSPPLLYEVTTETGMPHLEENLRYTTTREQRCTTQRQLSDSFPILHHPALAGCRLLEETRSSTEVAYRLVCEGGRGPTGHALWHLDPERVKGTLDVKLGGKNMTFYQRITALPKGACVL